MIGLGRENDEPLGDDEDEQSHELKHDFDVLRRTYGDDDDDEDGLDHNFDVADRRRRRRRAQL
jgi:hypothetical protein